MRKCNEDLKIATDLDAKLPQVNFVNERPDFFSPHCSLKFVAHFFHVDTKSLLLLTTV